MRNVQLLRLIEHGTKNLSRSRQPKRVENSKGINNNLDFSQGQGGSKALGGLGLIHVRTLDLLYIQGTGSK